MADTIPRIQVPKTDDLQHALTVAHQLWPDEKRTSRLVEKLAVRGAQVAAVHTETREERKARLLALVKESPTHFPPNYLENVREGWR